MQSGVYLSVPGPLGRRRFRLDLRFPVRTLVFPTLTTIGIFCSSSQRLLIVNDPFN